MFLLWPEMEHPQWSNYVLQSMAHNNGLVDWICVTSPQTTLISTDALPPNVHMVQVEQFKEYLEFEEALSTNTGNPMFSSLFFPLLNQYLPKHTHWGFAKHQTIFGIQFPFPVMPSTNLFGFSRTVC
jgi:hypothetical protein